MSPAPGALLPPPEGVWRIGRGDDPLRVPDREPLEFGDTRAGNRFDSVTGSFGVLYFASSLAGCFGETLNRYRADPALAFVDEEWKALGFMPRGSVPRDWRMRRTAVRVRVEPDLPFLDVEDAATLAFLSRELSGALAVLGYDQLDVALVRGRDRRVTRLISEWAWRQADDDSLSVAFGGIRYLSRTNSDWECWAVFDDMALAEVERQPILLTTPGLREVAELYDLKVF